MSKNTKQILIVEDDLGDVKAIKKALLDIAEHSEFIVTSSMSYAYEEFKSNHVDLVILDLNLPDGYGAASVQEMRRFNRSTPIVVLTGLASDATIEDAIKNGANACFLKSQIESDDFKSTVRHFL